MILLLLPPKGALLGLVQSLLLLVSAIGSVLEKLLDKVDVGHDHAAAAVALEAKLVHSITISLAGIRDQLEIALPKVAGDLSAGEATDGDNHFGYEGRSRGSFGFTTRIATKGS